ncbi:MULTISPECIES: hypothetical protein [unclassified Pseudomonas]|uniref:hypothetical protein n=1 Tax=unclassified Pseudomonas TaxID=196821 RepID=UPI002ACB1793|nr:MULTISPECIES: hypothetical protein [unclassified Pseudomonas]WPX56301.1 hypothetical protein RHM65_12485 [Pseudomonas sp. CCI4.2]WPX63809.1 hypothetical protein RHM59_23560 [Pseudomonas sp. MH10]
MRKVGVGFITMLALLCAFSASGKEARLTDSAIVQILINGSIASYPSNCPCPYNAAKNGSRCGKRSAYNRPGGYAPLCFKGDISKEMIEGYRGRVVQ